MKCFFKRFVVFLAGLMLTGTSLQSATGPEIKPVSISGFTMGTSWSVTYFDLKCRNFQESVDSLLLALNRSINHYDSSSEVSRFNASSGGIDVHSTFLRRGIITGKEIFSESGGAFDMTVMPLVNAWGFGPGKQVMLTPSKVDSILQFTGFDKVKLDLAGIRKADPRVQLDFGGIGQGYGVDLIRDFLHAKGIKDMIVELGGEGYAAGKNLRHDRSWQVGILDPNSTRDEQFFRLYVRVENKAFTTSGNYFNYRIIDGRKYGHTIDPRSGYPVQTELLSVTVFADDCIEADGWATAFMAMGAERAIECLGTKKDLDAIFLLSAPEGQVSMFTTEKIRSSVIVDEN